MDQANYQGNAVVNLTDRETPAPGLLSTKHFSMAASRKPCAREYPANWSRGDELLPN